MIYSLEELQKSYQAGNKYKYLFFWGHRAPANGSINQSCFSQWRKCSFTVDGLSYSCTEQFMMAEKARLFHDDEMLEKIMNAKHPKEMKAYGRAVRNFDKDIWDRNCYDIVKRGNYAKFSQNLELWRYLKTTKNRILVEASPTDRIWGIGMVQGDPAVNNPMKWRGTNLLGFALTKVRDQLLEKEGE
ncbi:NADAR family protein [Paenibacillus sp. SC116]|uniref:NADAR family protein n=1 Tax=Paenibacillus sp. SC116 TaxID=2968986 RepID=UPI00215A17C2|nr:NADAR family protein [Paenibacillus sp. SC116]MCR8842898.1 NADAR family protein [Paenibacillus sp. SC116]